MNKNVAKIDSNGKVVSINVHANNYELTTNEFFITGLAWVGGDYVDGFFYPPQPFPSWTRHKGEWQPPTPYPNDGDMYQWDEVNGDWFNA